MTCRSLAPRGAVARTASPGAPSTVTASSATASSTSTSGLSMRADNGRRMRTAESAIRLITHSPLPLKIWRGLYAMFDAEAVHAGADLVAAAHLGVLGRQRVEERPVARPEVADTDRAVGIGKHFEVAAGQELVGHAHVTLAADDEA